MPAPAVVAPPSKSLTHRALLLGALSEQACVVRNAGLGADNLSTLSALRSWGARATVDAAKRTVSFEPFEPARSESPLDCGNSGTSLRLLTGQAARFAFETVLTGDASLQTRPNGPLLGVLEDLGVFVDANDGRAPLTIRGPLQPRDVSLRGGLSSQFASSLLLALAQGPGPCVVTLLPPVASRPYLDLTLAVARAFGLTFDVEQADGGLRIAIAGAQRPSAPEFVVEGDWSGAAFPLVAGALLGRPVEVRGVRMDSAQGDRGIVDILRATGVEVEGTAVGVRVSGRAHRSPGPLDMGATPDLFPVVVTLAASLPGVTRLYGSPGLRHKECDRITAMTQGLTRMGADIEEMGDGAIVTGTPGGLRGATVRAFHDHRIHMALSIAALVAEGRSTVMEPECVDVSYPGFHADLATVAGIAPAPSAAAAEGAE